MNHVRKSAFPVLGVIFLALGVIQFLKGDDWVAWIILGVLFGGLGILRRHKGSDETR
ncbi:MAG: hypothetical protein ABIS23_02095 [Sphingomicrobium sp.]